MYEPGLLRERSWGSTARKQHGFSKIDTLYDQGTMRECETQSPCMHPAVPYEKELALRVNNSRSSTHFERQEAVTIVIFSYHTVSPSG